MMIEQAPLRVCVISLPSPSTHLIVQGLLNLVEILAPICAPLHVISAKIRDVKMPTNAHIVDIGTTMHPPDSIRPIWLSIFVQVLKVILIQMKISLNLLRISRKFDVLFVFLAVPYLLLPMLVARMLCKKVVIKTGGFYSEIAPTHHGSIASKVIALLERIGFALATTIAIESPVEQPKLGKHRNKASATGMHYFDMGLFVSKVDLADRKTVVGYIGKLTPQKGIMNFIEAMPAILRQRSDVEFFVGGGGPLFDQIETRLRDIGLSDKVRLAGWIPHAKVSDYWNELKLFLLPSEAEGLPRVALEAMACGTPVLATPVGGVPDIIKDSKTGFIMENNSPEIIAEHVIRALDHPDLELITNNARKLVERNYSYNATVERYLALLR